MSELTTSKVNRLFRSLRSKCVSLNSLTVAPPRPKVAVTYGSSSRNAPREQDDTPPLAILQSLDKLGSRLHFDRAIVENMQLSKRIYEVRDAFKNIVQSTFVSSKPETEAPSRILPLAGICARVVGEHVEVEMEASLVDLSGDEGGQDEVHGQIMDELYEQVPSQYRNYTLVAHALTYILDTCPHLPTLLHALLEVCTAHSLFTEARMVLRELFTTAIVPRPNSTCACPLTHPAHKNFLTTLRETCAGSGSETPTAVPPIANDRTFTTILVDVLCQPCPEHLHAWTSRAVVRLSRELAQQDFTGCFVPLVSGLATTLSWRHKPKKSPWKAGNDHSRSKLHEDALERLAKWLVLMLDTVYRSAPTADGLEYYSACIDFLVTVEPFRFHLLSAPPASPGACVVDALCCLTAYCLASPLASTAAVQPDLPVLERLLRDATIRNQTLDDLVSRILPLPSFTMFLMPLSGSGEHTPTPPPVDFALGDGPLGQIDALAAPLRGRGLLRCEAALYRGALEHVEGLISSPSHALPPSLQLGEKALHELRLQLLDRAEDAERRCYGNATDPSRPPDANQEWVWEEMVGSWVVKSPAPARAQIAKDRELERAAKRRRVGSSSLEKPRGLSKGSIFPSIPPSQARAGRPLLLPSTPGPSRDKENSSDDEDYQDIGTDPLIPMDVVDETSVPTRVRKFATTFTNTPRTPIAFGAARPLPNGAKPRPRASAPGRVVRFAVPEPPSPVFKPVRPRRQSNFTSLIADSHKNVISLREEKARARARASMGEMSGHGGRTLKSILKVHASSEDSDTEPATEDSDTEPATEDESPGLRQGESAPARVRASMGNAPAHGQRGLKRKRMALPSGEDSDTEPCTEEDNNCGPARGDSKAVEPESSPVRGAALVEPSSDDALDLFAYPDSSPVASRRRVL